jgi:plasmid stabilization system protein ParE
LTARSISIHPAALDEVLAAAEWYAKRSQRAAELFLDEIDRIIARLTQHAGQFPVFESGTRRAVLRRFPFSVVFRDASDGLEIVAVAHGRRNPGYWRGR